MVLNSFFSKEFIKEFFKDPVKGLLLASLVAISTLFTLLNRSQESKIDIYKTGWAECENENYIRDVKIEYLIASKAKSDSTLNRIMGKVEAIEELKKLSQ